MKLSKQPFKQKKAQVLAWAFFSVIAMSSALLFLNTVAFGDPPSLKATRPDEMSAAERKTLIQQLLEDGDRYTREKNYNIANATYESVFLLDADNIEASKRIDRLKKHMAKEGKSETDLVGRIYDAEIDMRVREYLKEAKGLVQQKKINQARFKLKKLLLLNPLHEEAKKLYDQLELKQAA